MSNNILQSRWFTVLAVVITGFFLLLIIKIEMPLRTTMKEVGNLDQKIAELQKSQEEAEKLGEFMKSDDYLERQARLKLNYKKPGENAVLVYGNSSENQKTEEANSNVPIVLPNWQKWLNYLLNKRD